MTEKRSWFARYSDGETTAIPIRGFIIIIPLIGISFLFSNKSIPFQIIGIALAFSAGLYFWACRELKEKGKLA